MMTKCSSVLLLSDIPSFCETVKDIGMSIDVKVHCESDWKKMFRVNQEMILCGSKYVDKINEAFYERTVIILKKDENPFPFINMGIERFVFDYSNRNEVMYSMLKKDKVYAVHNDERLEEILRWTTNSDFVYGDYDFNFDKNIFRYRGKPIYLSVFQQCYLARWLLLGVKDNKKRSHLCLMRKKFGKDFLKDIDRFGGIKR